MIHVTDVVVLLGWPMFRGKLLVSGGVISTDPLRFHGIIMVSKDKTPPQMSREVARALPSRATSYISTQGHRGGP